MDIFFLKEPATTEIYTLSLHDALPISEAAVDELLVAVLVVQVGVAPPGGLQRRGQRFGRGRLDQGHADVLAVGGLGRHELGRSEEHTSELQSRQYLVCRLLLEKKKQQD